MQVIQVANKKMVDEFHQVPEKIYRNDRNWIPQLRVFIENVFDPLKNAKFKTGEAKRWILEKDGEYVGRIAAFFDPDYASGYEQPTGGCGFFECINNKEAAFLLFNTAKSWLIGKGMEAMDGPINFGENFFNWGLLVNKFKPQTFGMPYNPAYYQKLFEDYGFKTYYEQYSYMLDITNPDLPDRFWKIAEWVTHKPGYNFEHFTFAESEKYLNDFIEIHRQAWNAHGNYKPVKIEELREMLNEAKSFVEEEFIWYVYHNKIPIGFFMMIPDLNQIVQTLKNGKLGFLKVIKMAWLKRHKVISRCRVIVLGIVPKYQNRGIESGIFFHLKKVMLKKYWYNEMEMSWVGDFNPKMNALFKSFGATKTNTHITYRYLFDPEKEFKRAPVIE